MAVKIILNRKNEWLNRLRPYKVLVDGEVIGKIANGKVEAYDIPQISHTIVCKIDWLYSNQYQIKAADGDTIYLQVKSGMKGFWVVYILLIMMVIINLLLSNQRQLFGETFYRNRMLLFLIPMLYYLYYTTIGRHKYLLLEKDRNNVFAS